jgi:hypothetical protein
MRVFSILPFLLAFLASTGENYSHFSHRPRRSRLLSCIKRKPEILDTSLFDPDSETWSISAFFLKICAVIAQIAFGLTLFVLAVGFITGIFLNLGSDTLVLLALGAIPLYYLNVIVHEFSHCLAAKAVGFQIMSFFIGPIGLQHSKSGFPGFCKSPLTWTGGGVDIVSPDCKNLRRRYALVLLAGPLMSGVACAACLGLASWWNGQPAFHPHAWFAAFLFRVFNTTTLTGACLTLSGIIGWFHSVGQFLPYQRKSSDARRSDGTQLLNLWVNGPRAECNLILNNLHWALCCGVRPRDWDVEMFKHALECRDNTTEDALINLYAYFWSVDIGQVDRAAEFLDLAFRQRDGNLAQIEHAILAEAAFYAGRYNRNPEARKWLQRIPSTGVEKQTLLRAEAAVLWAEGKSAEAAEIAKAALAAVPFSVDPGGAKSEHDWLLNLLAQIDLALSGLDKSIASAEDTASL